MLDYGTICADNIKRTARGILLALIAYRPATPEAHFKLNLKFKQGSAYGANCADEFLLRRYDTVLRRLSRP
jgi:hypothetical protein